MNQFNIGEWVRRKHDEKVGWVHKYSSYDKNRVIVQFLDLNYTSVVRIEQLESYDYILPEITEAMIDDALKARSEDWFDYLINKK